MILSSVTLLTIILTAATGVLELFFDSIQFDVVWKADVDEVGVSRFAGYVVQFLDADSTTNANQDNLRPSITHRRAFELVSLGLHTVNDKRHALYRKYF